MSNALVFGGGGGKGAYEIGVWKALREMGYEGKFSCVIGTSVGALNAALFAQRSYQAAEEIWLTVSNETILTSNFRKGSALASQDGLSNLLSRYLDLNSRDISMYACCSRVVRGNPYSSRPLGVDLLEEMEAEYIRLNALPKQEQIQYLLASAALPAAFDPVTIKGTVYRDGGIIPEHNLPCRKAAALGHSRILAVSLDASGATREAVCGNSRILILHPSTSLGGMLDGTLDFDASGSRFRMNLGYQDAWNHRKKIEFLLEEERQSILSDRQRQRLERIFRN